MTLYTFKEDIEEIVFEFGDYLSNLESLLLSLRRRNVPSGPNQGLVPFHNLIISQFNYVSAILDAWALLMDNMRFYQDRIVNNAYLKTCDDPYALNQLLHMLGEQVQMNTAATGTLVGTVKAQAPDTIDIPQGLQIKSIPAPGKQSVTYRSDTDTEWSQAWNKVRVATTETQVLSPDSNALYVQKPAAKINNGSWILGIGDLEKNPQDWCLKKVSATQTKNAVCQINWESSSLKSTTASFDWNTAKWVGLHSMSTIFGNKAPEFSLLPEEVKRKQGAFTGGAFSFDRAKNHWTPANKGLGAAVIQNYALSKRGYLFAASSMGVMRSYNQKIWGAANSGLPTLQVDRILITGPKDKEEVYIGTKLGVYRSDDYGLHWHPDTEGLGNQQILSLAITEHDSHLYAGTASGLFGKKIGDKDWSEIKHFKGMSIYSLSADAQEKRLYVGTNNGVHHGEFRDLIWTKMKGLDGTNITAIFRSTKGDLFVGTHAGLFMWESREWTASKTGLPAAGITAILEDALQTLYISSSKGVYCSTDQGKSWFRLGFDGQMVSDILLSPDAKLWASPLQYKVPDNWPHFHLNGDTVDLSQVVGKAKVGGLCLFVTESAAALFKIESTSIVHKQAFMLKSSVSSLRLSAAPDPQVFGIRNTFVYLVDIPLSKAKTPLLNAVSGQTIRVQGKVGCDTIPKRVLVSELTESPQGPKRCEWAEIISTKELDDGDTELKLNEALRQDYERASCVLQGNTLNITQGTHIDEVIGSGDSNRSQQNYYLSRSDLLFTKDKAGTLVPSIQIFVNQELWTRVNDVYEAGSDQKVYMLSLNDSKVTITFGNGVHGAIPPNGTQNIRAIYIAGNGSEGNARENKITQVQSSYPVQALTEAASRVAAVSNPVALDTGVSVQQFPKSTLVDKTKALQVLQSPSSIRDIKLALVRLPGVAQALVSRYRFENGSDGIMAYLVLADEEKYSLAAISTQFRSLCKLHIHCQFKAITRVNFSAKIRVKRVDDSIAKSQLSQDITRALSAQYDDRTGPISQVPLESKVLKTIQDVAGVRYASVSLHIPSVQGPPDYRIDSTRRLCEFYPYVYCIDPSNLELVFI